MILGSELHAEEILKLEFEYARETANQAQNDRTVIVNLYLLLVGGAGSLLLAAESLAPIARFGLPGQAIAIFFFLMGLLGTLTLLKLIRLRQAWFDSVRAMSTIKAYYLKNFPELDAALLWKTKTIPSPGKAWTITFILSAMVILLDSISYAAALHLLEIRHGDAQLLLDGILLFSALGVQLLFYFYELRSPAEKEIKTAESK